MDSTIAPALDLTYRALSKPPRREWVRPMVKKFTVETMNGTGFPKYSQADWDKINKMGGDK